MSELLVGMVMSELLVGMVLILIGSVVGALAALWFVVKGDVKAGDQPIRPYDDDHEGWS